MGFEGLKIRIQIKRGLIFSTRTCYRSVCNHPFLVGFVFFLIFLYRSFPFLFSLLVSSSPVLVCTIVLLGTLLSFGQPHIPEIEKDIEKEVEKEEKITHEISALKSRSGVLEDAVVVERGESFGVDRYTGKGEDAVEKAIEDRGLEEINVSKVEKGDGLVECAPLIEENSREIDLEKRVIEEEEGEYHDFQCGPTGDIHEEKPTVEGVLGKREVVLGEREVVLGEREVVENQYTLIQSLENEDHEVENDKSQVGSVVAQMGDSLEFSPGSSWKHVEDDNEPSDSGSDGGESSSPDASMADIIPLLDELHPLLDSEAPQPVLVSHDDSDAVSEQSRKNNDGSAESSEDSENQEEEEDDVDDEGDDDEDDEEEGAQGSKEDETKSGITWTEDDQKNLMDLGTSELERNQRLENLIIRRRARKNLKMMAEKNLIDLETSDPPFYVPPISTTRRNPFDSPCDSYDNMGLPPIPGSAPSILIPRRNPFDLPYDSSEEKPDLKGDSFEQEFMAFHQKDMLFRRHESFSLGASSFGGPRHERQHIKWRPYFVPERMAGEGASYPVFERQSSGFSDSKASSVPETESLSSVVDEEDTKVIDQNVSQETEVMSNIDHVSNRVEDGRQSHEDSDSEESDQAEKAEIDLNVVAQPADEVNHHEIESSFATPIVLGMSEVHLEAEAGEDKYSSRSSSSQSSVVSDQSFDLKPDEESSILESRKAEVIEESGIQIQPSQEGSDFSFTTGIVVAHHHKEPVYDSSPPAVEKNLSSSSISSDLPVEMSEIDVPTTVSSETTAPSACKESEVSKEIMVDTSGNEEIWATSSQLHAVDDNESRSEEVKEMSEHDDIKFGFSAVDQNSDNPRSLVPESVLEHISTDSSSSASDTESVEEVVMHKNESFQHEQDQVDQLNFGVQFQTREVQQEVSENRDLMTSRDLDMPSENITLSAIEEQHPSLMVEQVSVAPPNLPSSETNSVEEDSANKEEPLQFEHHQVHSSGYDAEIGDNQDVDEKLVSVDGSNLSSSETKSVEGDSTRMEETLLFEHDQVSSLGSDAKIGGQKDVDGKLVSADGPYLSSSETKSVEEGSTIMEGTLQFENDQVTSLGSDAKIGDQQDVDGKLVSVDGSNSSSSDTKSVEEDTTIMEETLQFEHDQVTSPGSDAKIGDQQDVDGKQVSVDGFNLSSSETKSVGENSTGKEETLHDEVYSPVSDVKIGDHQNVDEKLVSVDGSDFSSSETKAAEENSTGNEENLQFEHDQVHLSSSDAKISSHQDVDEKLGDSFQNVSSREMSLPELEKSLPSPMSDKSTVEPSLDDHEEIKAHGPYIIPAECIEEVGITSNLNVLRSHEPEDDISSYPSFASILSEVSENRPPSSAVDLKYDIVEGSENDGQKLSGLVLLDFPVAASHVLGENVDEEEDGVKEFDEGLLAELDRVGDFSVNGVGSNLNEIEERGTLSIPHDTETKTIQFVEDDCNEVDECKVVFEEENDKFPEVKESDSGFQLSRASSIEHVGSSSREIGDGEVKHSKPNQEPITNLEMLVIEARSLEDIDLAFKDTDSVSKETEVKFSDSMLHGFDINLGMHMIEARSLEDIDLVLKDAEPVSRETEIEAVGSVIPDVEINSRMPIIEARSLEDINLAFKDTELMSKEAEVKLVESIVRDLVIDSGMPTIEAQSLEDIDVVLKDAEPMSIETEVEAAEFRIPDLEINSTMPVIEAQSLEDIHLAFEDTGSMSKETEVEGGSKVPENDVNSKVPRNDVNSEILVIEARSLEDIDLALKDTELMSKGTEVEIEKSKVPVHKISMEMPIIEARSLEDIELALNDAESGSKESKIPDPEINSLMSVLEDQSIEEIDTACKKNIEEEGEKPIFVEPVLFPKDLELPVLEARSMEDTDLAFKQLHGGVDLKKPIISSSIDEKPLVESKYRGEEINSDLQMVEARLLDGIHKALKLASEGNAEDKGSSSKENESKTYLEEEINSDLQMVEARSLDDIHKALKQASGGNAEDKGSSSKENESRTEEFGIQSTSDNQTLGHGIGNSGFGYWQ